MAYTLLASESTVHALSTTDVIDAVRATVQTPQHGQIFASIVASDIWGVQAGIDQLNHAAFYIDDLLNISAATAAIGNQSIDENGLLQQVCTFTVSYTPPGSTLPPLTMTVDIPMPWLETADPVDGQPGPTHANQVINDAEAQLKAMAGA